MSDYPKDGTDCCNHDPAPGQQVAERCPKCLHYTLIDGVLNCTYSDCITNKLDYHCNNCGEDFDACDPDTGKDVEPTKCPFCHSLKFCRSRG